MVEVSQGVFRNCSNLHLVGSFWYEETWSCHKGSYDNKEDEDGEYGYYGRHYTQRWRGESEMFGLVINVMRLLGNSNMNLDRASAFFLFSRFHYSLWMNIKLDEFASRCTRRDVARQEEQGLLIVGAKWEKKEKKGWQGTGFLLAFSSKKVTPSVGTGTWQCQWALLSNEEKKLNSCWKTKWPEILNAMLLWTSQEEKCTVKSREWILDCQ